MLVFYLFSLSFSHLIPSAASFFHATSRDSSARPHNRVGSPAGDLQQGCPMPPPPQPGHAPPNASSMRHPKPPPPVGLELLRRQQDRLQELAPRAVGPPLVRSVPWPELACAPVRSQLIHPAVRSELALAVAARTTRMCGGDGEALPSSHAQCVSSSSLPMPITGLLFFVVSLSHLRRPRP